MKKFFTCILILAVFSAVIFCIGWTQFRVKPEKVGVVISKTHGIDKTPVQNGQFAWHWQFLLPTNAALETFSIKPVNVEKTITGQLPSGKLYTSIYNSSDAFSYSFTFSISLTIGPDAIISLLEQNKISDNEDLQEYLNKAADSIAQLSADYYLKKAQENPSFRPESVRRDDLLRSIQIYKECPEIELSTFALISSKIPDFNLYKKLQAQSLSDINMDSQTSHNSQNSSIQPDNSGESEDSVSEIL